MQTLFRTLRAKTLPERLRPEPQSPLKFFPGKSHSWAKGTELAEALNAEAHTHRETAAVDQSTRNLPDIVFRELKVPCQGRYRLPAPCAHYRDCVMTSTKQLLSSAYS